MDPLDLDQFRSPSKQAGTSEMRCAKHQRSARRKAGRWFLKGPIPGEWLGPAAALSGRALHVALALWHLATLRRTQTVKLTWEVMRRFGVSPDSGRRGLAALEQAGLVTVDRHRGRCAMVTIRSDS